MHSHAAGRAFSGRFKGLTPGTRDSASRDCIMLAVGKLIEL